MSDKHQYNDLAQEVLEFLVNTSKENVAHTDIVTASFMYPEEVANQLYKTFGVVLLAHEAFLCGMRWQQHLDSKKDDKTSRLLNDVELGE